MRRSAHDRPWLAKMDEMLSDGEWHLGRDVMREAEKHVLPGVAWRKVEEDRERSARRRGNTTKQRKIKQPTEVLVAMGKKAVVQNDIWPRVRMGSWQVEPWPVPKGTWYQATWRIRDLRKARTPQTHVAQQFGVRVSVIRDLVLLDPPLEHHLVGRVLYVANEALPDLTGRVKDYLADSSLRRALSNSAAAQRKREQARTKIPLSVLSRDSGISTRTGRELMERSPWLQWETRGRVIYLPGDQLAGWAEMVTIYQGESAERRSAANRQWRQAKREGESSA